jgi:hypothetical protein
MEGDVGPQRGRQAADALTASRRQGERLELAPHLIGLAGSEDERGASGWLEAAVWSDSREQQALGASRLGRRPAGHYKRLGAAVLVLDSGAAADAG